MKEELKEFIINNLNSFLSFTKKSKGENITLPPTEKFAGKHLAAFNCVSCEKETTRRIERFEQEKRFLCRKCILQADKETINNKIKTTNLERYGVEHSLQNKNSLNKKNATMVERYGVENNLESKLYREKLEEKMIIKYGVKNVSSSQIIKEQKKETTQKKYGVDNIMKNDEIKQKMVITTLKNSLIKTSKNFTPMFDINNYTGKIDKAYEWRCNKCETVFDDKMHNTRLMPRCPKCNPTISGTSQGEQELQTFTQGKKYRDHFEIDALINNIGFEFNGLYWHSEKFHDSGYHLMKTNYFKEKGIQVYHIFEDEWSNKKEIVKSIINAKLNRLQTTIYGRKCVIKEVDTRNSRIFQDENHIQGKANAAINVGLYYEDELVSLMTFGGSRFDNSHQYELVRFVNKKNTRVLGGASKCFKYFVRNYNPINIVSYSDTRLFGGEMYEKLNFKFTHSTRPQYYYVKNGKRYNRMKFQKHKLKELFEDYDINKTERQMMAENNFLRIYDCGMKVWVYENK